MTMLGPVTEAARAEEELSFYKGRVRELESQLSVCRHHRKIAEDSVRVMMEGEDDWERLAKEAAAEAGAI